MLIRIVYACLQPLISSDHHVEWCRQHWTTHEHGIGPANNWWFATVIHFCLLSSRWNQLYLLPGPGRWGSAVRRADAFTQNVYICKPRDLTCCSRASRFVLLAAAAVVFAVCSVLSLPWPLWWLSHLFSVPIGVAYRSKLIVAVEIVHCLTRSHPPFGWRAQPSTLNPRVSGNWPVLGISHPLFICYKSTYPRNYDQRASTERHGLSGGRSKPLKIVTYYYYVSGVTRNISRIHSDHLSGEIKQKNQYFTRSLTTNIYFRTTSKLCEL